MAKKQTPAKKAKQKLPSLNEQLERIKQNGGDAGAALKKAIFTKPK